MKKVTFVLNIEDGRFPGLLFVSDGTPNYRIYFKKGSKTKLIDSFTQVEGKGSDMSHEEALHVADMFFEKYRQSGLLQEAYRKVAVSL